MPSITIVDTSDPTGRTSFTLSISGDVTKLRVDNLQSFVRTLQDEDAATSATTPLLTFRDQQLVAGQRCGQYGMSDGSVVFMTPAEEEPEPAIVASTSYAAPLAIPARRSPAPPPTTLLSVAGPPSPALVTPQRQLAQPVNIFTEPSRSSPLSRPQLPPSVPKSRGTPSPREVLSTPRDALDSPAQDRATPTQGPPPTRLPRRASMRSTPPIIPAGRGTPTQQSHQDPAMSSHAPLPLVSMHSGGGVDDNASMTSESSAVYPYTDDYTLPLVATQSGGVGGEHAGRPTAAAPGTSTVQPNAIMPEALLSPPSQPRDEASTGYSRATTPNFSVRVPDYSAGNLSFSAALPDALRIPAGEGELASPPPVRLPRRASMKMSQRQPADTSADGVPPPVLTQAPPPPPGDTGGDSMDPRPPSHAPAPPAAPSLANTLVPFITTYTYNNLVPFTPMKRDDHADTRSTASPSQQQVRTPTSRASPEQLLRRASLRNSPVQSEQLRPVNVQHTDQHATDTVTLQPPAVVAVAVVVVPAEDHHTVEPTSASPSSNQHEALQSIPAAIPEERNSELTPETSSATNAAAPRATVATSATTADNSNAGVVRSLVQLQSSKPAEVPLVMSMLDRTTVSRSSTPTMDSPARTIRTPTSRASPEQLQRRSSMRRSPSPSAQTSANEQQSAPTAVLPLIASANPATPREHQMAIESVAQFVNGAMSDPKQPTMFTPLMEPEPTASITQAAQWEAETQQQLDTSSLSPVPASSSAAPPPPPDRSSPVLVRRASHLRQEDGAISPARPLGTSSPSSALPEPPRQLSRRASMKMERVAERTASPVHHDVDQPLQTPAPVAVLPVAAAATVTPTHEEDFPLVEVVTSPDTTPSMPPSPPPNLSLQASHDGEEPFVAPPAHLDDDVHDTTTNLVQQAEVSRPQSITAAAPLEEAASFEESAPRPLHPAHQRLELEVPQQSAPGRSSPPPSPPAPLAQLPAIVQTTAPPALTPIGPHAVDTLHNEALLKAISPTSHLRSDDLQEASGGGVEPPQLSPSPQAPSLPLSQSFAARDPSPVLPPARVATEVVTEVPSKTDPLVATASTSAALPTVGETATQLTVAALTAEFEPEVIVQVAVPTTVAPLVTPHQPPSPQQAQQTELPRYKSPPPENRLPEVITPPSPAAPPHPSTYVAPASATSVVNRPPSSLPIPLAPFSEPLSTEPPQLDSPLAHTQRPPTPSPTPSSTPSPKHAEVVPTPLAKVETAPRPPLAPSLTPVIEAPTAAGASPVSTPTKVPPAAAVPAAKAPSPKPTAQSTLSMLRARRATTTTSTTPPKAPGVAGAPSRQSSLSPAAARSRAATLTQQSPPPSHSQRSQGVVSSSSPKPPQQPSAASPTPKAPPAASTASPVQRTASPAAASASSTSAAERYKLLMAKKAEAAASSSTMRAPSPTTTRARAMTLPANKSPLRPGAASSPTRTRIARLTKRLANLSKAAGRYQDALDVRLQSQVIAGEVRKMQTLLAETPSDQLLPSALQRVDALERQLRSTKSALSRHEESTAVLLLGVGRLTQLIHDVVEPLAAREDALSRLGTRAHAGPPRLRRVVDELHSITTDRVTEEMASWEELSTTGRAYKEACRLERIIYTELHDRVEAECLMQVHKSQTYESLYDGHKRELVMLNGELQRVTAVVKNNTIVMRRKGRLFDDDHHAFATNSDEEEEPAAMEPTSVPKPTPMLTVDEFTSLKHSVEVLQREYREATETQKQHNTAFVEARRELERELARLQHQRKEAAKALVAQEKSFAYFEARVHGMDPNDKELPDLLEACVREASPETREASPDVDGEAPKDEHDEGGEGEGYVSAFRRHAPKKLYISSKRTVDDVRGPTIASIAREEASLETRIRADEVRRY